jgi:hypothetical protein
VVLAVAGCTPPQQVVAPATIEIPSATPASTPTPAVATLKGERARASDPRLTEKYTPGSQLVRIHFDPRFTVNADDDDLTFLEPTADSGLSPSTLVTVITSPNPISQNVDEYTRALQGARQKALGGYHLDSLTKGACYRDLPGVETRWVFDEKTPEYTKQMKGRACAFIHNGHGYSLMYAFDPSSPRDEAGLRRIVEAVELTDEEPPGP